MSITWLTAVVVLPMLVLSLSIGIVLIVAALKMMSLTSYRWAVAGSIVSLLPVSPVNLLGLAAGIWSLIVLNRASVIAGFDAQKTYGGGSSAIAPRPASERSPGNTTDAASGIAADAPRPQRKHRTVRVWLVALLVMALFAFCLVTPVPYWLFSNSQDQVSPPRPAAGPVMPGRVSSSGWLMSSDGPALTDVFARTVLKLQPEQIQRVNEVLQTSYREFLEIERQHTTQGTDTEGRLIGATVKPFPELIAKLEDGLWTQLDMILNPEQQSLARLNLRIDPAPMQPPISLNEIVAPGLFGWGKAGAIIEIWRVGSWFHWRVTTRGYTNTETAPQLPEMYRRFWKELPEQP